MNLDLVIEVYSAVKLLDLKLKDGPITIERIEKDLGDGYAAPYLKATQGDHRWISAADVNGLGSQHLIRSIVGLV